MKKKLLGLGICALALGAVAGAVSARRALEANATDDVKDWELVGNIGGEDYWGDGGFAKESDNVIVAELSENDQIKLRYGTTWDVSVNGLVLSALKGQIGGEDSNVYFVDDGTGNHNAIVQKTGTYTFTLPSNYAEYGDKTYGLAVTFEAPAADPVVYTAKLGDAAISLTSIDPEGDDMKEQYEATITANKGDVITLYADGDKITDNLNHDTGSSVLYGTSGNFTVHNDITAQSLYIKIWKSGWVTLWADGFVQGPTGYYIITKSGSWSAASGIISDGAYDGNIAAFVNVEFEANEEFLIGKFDDGERDSAAGWATDIGWDQVDSENSGAYASFEGAADNHIKVKTAGAYCVYYNDVVVSETTVKKIYLNAYSASADDYDAVDTFVATYITAKAGAPEEGDSCDAKYTAAAAALAALNAIRQDLFWNDAKYADARAIFEYWRDHRAGATIYNIEGVTKANNNGLVIALVAIGAVAVASASIFFATRKRKNK